MHLLSRMSAGARDERSVMDPALALEPTFCTYWLTLLDGFPPPRNYL